MGRPRQPLLLDRPQERPGRFLATQIFPFADPVSFGAYMDFETAVYENALSAV